MIKRGCIAAISLCIALIPWTTAHADAVTDWNEIAAAAVAAGRPGPIGQADLALVQVAVHDAIQAYEKRFEPYFAEVKPKGRKVAAAVAAAHGVLVGFYPAQAATLDATYATYLADNGLTGNEGLAVGEAVAALILPLRRLDPNPLPAPFTGGTEIGQWRPTESFLPAPPPTLAPMAVPWMASFDPFTLTGPARFRAPPPPDLTSDVYTADYNEVKAKGALTNSTRTANRRTSLTSGPTTLQCSGTGPSGKSSSSTCRTSATARDSSPSPISPGRMRSSPPGTARSTISSGVP